MNKLTRLLLTSLIPLSLAAVVGAQPAPPEGDDARRGPGPHRAPPVIRVLDVDGDRELSAAELAQAATRLKTLDANQDGVLSAAELHPAPPAPPAGEAPRDGKGPRGPRGPGGPGGPGQNPVMLALDANQDGTLSAAEIAGASASLAALDDNKDGKLTRDELRPLPPTPPAGK
ncbi:MAG: hypothetical protein JNJ82_09685 [Opitutaceae bacterium]|jgi:hypothetical protein|nr:hypothetical protein [Opitutaceae bacterium]